jgi:hypothetical protein
MKIEELSQYRKNIWPGRSKAKIHCKFRNCIFQFLFYKYVMNMNDVELESNL